MIKTTILLEDKKVIEQLNRLLRFLSPDGREAVFIEADHRIRKKIKIKPPEPTGAPLPKRYKWQDGKLHKFKSIEAQRGFFKALKSGTIKVPYERKNILLSKLSYRVEPQPNGILIKVSLPEKIDRFKPGWVVGTVIQQSGYFRNLTNWKPLTFLIEQHESEIVEAVKESVDEIAKDLRLGD